MVAAACPTEITDAHTLDGHYPSTSNNILAFVGILLVNAFTVENTNLIVQKVATGSVGKEVTLNLNTDVTAIGSLFARAIRETCQL